MTASCALPSREGGSHESSRFENRGLHLRSLLETLRMRSSRSDVPSAAWFAAASLGNLERMQNFLVNRKVNVNRCGMWHRSALWLAAAAGQVGSVQFLLEAGADIEQKDRLDGFRPLHIAVYHGHPGVVRTLLEAGADVNARNTNGRTPYDLVAQTLGRVYRHEIEALLLQAGGHGSVALGMPLIDGAAPTGDVRKVQMQQVEGGEEDEETALIMQGPPGSVPGERLLVRLVDGATITVEVPEERMRSNTFVTRLPRPLTTDDTGRGEGEDAGGPSYGRAMGHRLPTIDPLVVEVVALSENRSDLEKVDEIARALERAGVPNKRARRMAVEQMLESGADGSEAAALVCSGDEMEFAPVTA